MLEQYDDVMTTDRGSMRGTEGGLQHPVRAVEQRAAERVPQRADVAHPQTGGPGVHLEECQTGAMM